MNWTIKHAHSIARQWNLATMLLAMLYPNDPSLARVAELCVRYERASKYLIARMGRGV